MPVKSLLERLQSSHNVKEWFEAEYKAYPPLIYHSIDIRNAGYKLAPVDVNLFPAGFNNLSDDGMAKAATCLKTRFDSPAHILIILENHTRNQNYLDSATNLKRIFETAGHQVTLANFLNTDENQHSIVRLNDSLLNSADYIILNNDLTSGIPDILHNYETFPPAAIGWHQRKKSHHFEQYDAMVKKFSHTFDIDPWLISSYWHRCNNIDFRKKEGLECVARNVEKLLHKIRKKHEEYGVTEEPYVFVKADSGTYGMGIMMVRSGEEVFAINKKNRNKMHTMKEGVQNTEVLIQEGIPTVDMINGAPSENLIYVVNGEPIQDIRRINTGRDRFSSLNTAGMSFLPTDVHTGLGIIARLSVVASSMELANSIANTTDNAV